MKRRELIQRILFACVTLILLFTACYSGLQILESVVSSREMGETPPVPTKTIIRDGTAYYPRQDITVILLMGIDESGPVRSSESYDNTGEVDVAVLFICDETREQIRVLNLNRDTILEMPVLGVDGRRAGSITGQLALSHTYGSGLDDSCENTRTAVSDLLNGIRIDHYFAMNMDAVSILNDAVGGVGVTVTDDFSGIDPEFPTGTCILRGDQAITFLRSRKNLGDQLNISRMQRQNHYMEGFLTAFRRRTVMLLCCLFTSRWLRIL